MRHRKETLEVSRKLGFVKTEQFDAIQKLRNISTKLRRMYECDCNGTDKTDAQERDFIRSFGYDAYSNYRNLFLEKNEKEIEKLQRQAIEIGKSVGLAIYHQTDPRGRSIYYTAIDKAQELRSHYSQFDCL